MKKLKKLENNEKIVIEIDNTNYTIDKDMLDIRISI